jgi:hypothetical protein
MTLADNDGWLLRPGVVIIVSTPGDAGHYRRS